MQKQGLATYVLHTIFPIKIIYVWDLQTDTQNFVSIYIIFNLLKKKKKKLVSSFINNLTPKFFVTKIILKYIF